MAATPFDDLRALIAAMPAPDTIRAAGISLPAGTQALAPLAQKLAMWREKPILRPLVAVFAATNGFAAAAGVAEAIAQGKAEMAALTQAESPLAKLCQTLDISLKVFDLAIDLPTNDARNAESLTEQAAAATFAFGMEAIAGNTDVVCPGAIGAGCDVAAAALLAALFGGTAADWLAEDDVSGTPARPDLAAAQAMIAQHAPANRPMRVPNAQISPPEALDPPLDRRNDPLALMRKIGGREIAAIAGAILAARIERIPVLLSGLPCLAAAMVLFCEDARALDHCFLAHPLPGEGMQALLVAFSGNAGQTPSAPQTLPAPAGGLAPLLAYPLSRPDGTGAALALPLLRAAASLSAPA